MTEHDEAIHRYMSLNPKRFSVLDRLELSQKSSGKSPAYLLVLEMWLRISENEDDDPLRLYLSFHRINALKINPHGFIQIPFLEIVSIKEYQWEGLKYRVSDVEENQLSFYCHQFEAEVIERRGTSSNA